LWVGGCLALLINRVNSHNGCGHDDSNIIITPHRITTLQPVVTDRVAWSVGLSVGLAVRLTVYEPYKNG